MKNFSSKEFAQIVKGAGSELNATFSSPFIIINLLNKAAKGDFSKVANCEGLTRENLAKVAKVVKTLHGGRYHFDFCVLPKACGKLGTFKVIPEKASDKAAILCGEVVTYKGKELSINACGEVGIFAATKLTISGVFSAFAKAAKVEIKESEKAAKEEEKAAKKAEKEYKNAKRGIISDYNNGLFGEDILAAKLAALREQYGK